jgi:TrmH family RNA methyltransferase
MSITSPDNPGLKEIRKLRSASARSRSGRFVAEGEDLVAMADSFGWTAMRRMVAAGSGLEGDEVQPDLLRSVSELESGARAIAVYEQSWAQPVLSGVSIHLHGLSDPGNVGTIIRTAHALGASCVTVGADTADPFGPRAVRASMGSIFAIPVARLSDPLEGEIETVALVSGAGGSMPSAIAGSARLIIGSERDGVPESVTSGCTQAWTIPLAEGAESLNASAAAAIALFAANRMRSQ